MAFRKSPRKAASAGTGLATSRARTPTPKTHRTSESISSASDGSAANATSPRGAGSESSDADNDSQGDEEGDNSAPSAQTPTGRNEPKKAIIDDMKAYEFSDSESVLSGFDLEEEMNDDDDYDDVDNISTTSEDSREFEREVERDIEAEGDAVFDWKDEQTYGYDEAFNNGLYDISHDATAADLDLTRNAFSAQQDLLDSYNFSWTRDSSDASTTTEERAASIAGGSNLEDGEETEDDDEDHAPTIHSPGLKLTRSADRKTRGPESRVISGPPAAVRVADPSRMPTPRKVKIDPRRAVAFTVNGPLGRSVRYITPRGRSYRWVDLRSSTGSNSVTDSGASSPTMINLDEAIMQGNTRTGAHITDVVHGAIFRFTNCPTSPTAAPPTGMSSFYRSLMFDPVDNVFGGQDEVLFEHELIDFEQCDEPSTAATPSAATDSPTPLPSKPAAAAAAAARPVTPAMAAAAPSTPAQKQMQQLTLGRDSSSPMGSAGARASARKRSVPAPEAEATPLAKRTRSAVV